MLQVLNRDVSIQVMRLFVQKRAEEMRAKAKRKAARRAAQQAESKASEASLDTSSIDLPPGVFSEAEQITVLDALAASGLRSVRYLKECEGIAKVVINDLEPAAVELANRNIEFNQVRDYRDNLLVHRKMLTGELYLAPGGSNKSNRAAG